MRFYYWSPFLSEVATVNAVINSAHSLKKYSKGAVTPYIINSVGEWSYYANSIKKKKIKLINFKIDSKFYEKLPRYSYFKSRYSYLLIILKTYKILYEFLKKKNDKDYIIIHLISSLPLIFLVLFNFKCNFILRISGYPKLNFFRKLLWKLSGKKLLRIFSPTEDTKKMLTNKNIFIKKKIRVLRDPIVDFEKINNLKSKRINKLGNYIINVGRLTEQKNQKFLINSFAKIKKIFKELKLVILGDGELKNSLIKMTKELNIEKDVLFLGYQKNVYKYYQNAICLVMTSKWEDPGFVMIEAASCKLPILSSDCNNGPKEFILRDQRGYLYKNFNTRSFETKFIQLMNERKLHKKKIKSKILKAFKESKKYTEFSHCKILLNNKNI